MMSSETQPLDDWFIALLACPGCDERLPLTLAGDQQALTCACGRYSFPVTDGIPVLLMESAIVLDESKGPGVGEAAKTEDGKP